MEDKNIKNFPDLKRKREEEKMFESLQDGKFVNELLTSAIYYDLKKVHAMSEALKASHIGEAPGLEREEIRFLAEMISTKLSEIMYAMEDE